MKKLNSNPIYHEDIKAAVNHAIDSMEVVLHVEFENKERNMLYNLIEAEVGVLCDDGVDAGS